MKINALIIDDETHCREALKFLINRSWPNINIIGEAKSVAEAEAFLEINPPQLLFLDIHLPGMNGLDFLKIHQGKGFETIITTAFDEYVLKALKYSAIDYLLKPIDGDELIAALKKATNRIIDKQ